MERMQALSPDLVLLVSEVGETMTRKDFASLAAYLKDLHMDWIIVDQLADWCYTQNPRFNKVKFMHAAGW